jgi:hypothetical protein
MKVYDPDGNELGEFTLSDRQQEALSGGGAITVMYHTPQLLHSVLGTQQGKFDLYFEDDHLTTDTPAVFRQYLDLRAAVDAARKAN